MNDLVVCETGGGKNALQHLKLMDAVEKRKFVIAHFPHARPWGYTFIAELYAKYGDSILPRLIVEELDGAPPGEEEKVVMRKFVQVSAAANPWKQDQENEAFRWNELEQQAARRNMTDIGEHPNLEQWGTLILKVGQHQDQWYPECELSKCLRPNTKWWRYFAEHCTNEDARRELLMIPDVLPNPRDHLTTILAAARLFDGVHQNAIIRMRCSKPPRFDRQAFLNRGGIWVTLGGVQSPDALRVYINNDLIETAFWALNGQLTRPGEYWIDEVINYRICQSMLSKLLATLRFTGMKIGLLAQSFNFPTPEITSSIVQNTDHYFGRSSDPDTADYMARSHRGALDPYKVHHEDEITRQIHAGFDEIERTTKGKQVDEAGNTRISESVSPHLVPRYEYLTERRKVYQSGQDQQFWNAADIQELPVGTFWVHTKERAPYLWRVPFYTDSWVFPGLAQTKARECIRKLKASSAYDTPGTGRLDIPDPPPIVVQPVQHHQNGNGNRQKNGSHNNKNGRKHNRQGAASRLGGNGRKR